MRDLIAATEAVTRQRLGWWEGIPPPPWQGPLAPQAGAFFSEARQAPAALLGLGGIGAAVAYLVALRVCDA